MEERRACLPDFGCSTMIEVKRNFDKTVAEITKTMEVRAAESKVFWAELKESLLESSLLIKECVANAHEVSIKFRDGAHRMENTEETAKATRQAQRDHEVRADCQLTDHETGEAGQHKLEAKALGARLAPLERIVNGLVIGQALMLFFLAVEHGPKLIDFIKKW